MVAAPRIEVATPDDSEAIARLRAAQGWRRSDPVVRAMLATSHARIFTVRAASVGASDGVDASEPIATAGALSAGPIGIIGNVAVSASLQRHGLGRLLTTHAITWLRQEGARSVWLDATPQGRPLYLKLGFTDIAPSWFGQRPIRDLDKSLIAAQAVGYTVRETTADALAALEPLDAEAFGGVRTELLRHLLCQPECALYVASASDDASAPLLGYAIIRHAEPPYHGYRLGSMVAPNNAVAAALTLATIHDELRRAPAEVASGVSGVNVSGGAAPRARAWFDSIGLTTTDDDTVMRLLIDGAAPPTASAQDLATAQERAEGRPNIYSWIAPMLF